MRRFPHIVLISLLFLSLVLNIVLLRQLYSGRVVTTVYDGDSFELENGSRVRLLGVDAPEKGRCGYEEAKQALTAYLLGKRVRLKNVIVDDYGRLVANVIVEDFWSWVGYLFHPFFDNFVDPMMNRAMASKGLAKNLSVASPYKETIDQVADSAKNRELGIYSPQCRSSSPPSKCAIKGNIQQEGKFYVLPGCKTYSQVIVDLSFGDAWFCTENDAKSAGFILSKSCR
jgi:micrococcal nuclease